MPLFKRDLFALFKSFISRYRATADYISLYCTSFLPLQGNNYCMIRAGSQHNPLANDAKIRSILSSAIP